MQRIAALSPKMHPLTLLITSLPLTLAAVGDSCQAPIGAGTCQDVPNCTGVVYNTDLCPNDPTNIMCCVESPCTANGVDGVCRSTPQECPGGDFIDTGTCPGDDSIICCIPDASTTKTVGEKVLAQAEKAALLPYAWGGGSCSGPSHDEPPYEYGDIGFDCSGLVCWALCKVTGRDLFSEGLRVTSTMYCASEATLGYKKYPLAERQPGDAIFFGGACDCSTSGSIHHVGLMIDTDDRFWNSPDDQINKVEEASISGFGEAPCPSVIRFT